jgi:hypothetical protein
LQQNEHADLGSGQEGGQIDGQIADEKIEEVKKAVGKVERKQEDSEKRIEENMAKEMRAREAIRRNIIVHGIPEPDSRIKTEADLVVCDQGHRIQPSKENVQHFKKIIFLLFSIFVGHFCLPGSGSGLRTQGHQ